MNFCVCLVHYQFYFTLHYEIFFSSVLFMNFFSFNWDFHCILRNAQSVDSLIYTEVMFILPSYDHDDIFTFVTLSPVRVFTYLLSSSSLPLLLFLFACLPVCLSVRFLSVCVSVCLPVCPPSVCLSVCPLSVCLSVCMAVYLFICFSVCLSVCPLSVCLSIHFLSVCLSVCLSICMITDQWYLFPGVRWVAGSASL